MLRWVSGAVFVALGSLARSARLSVEVLRGPRSVRQRIEHVLSITWCILCVGLGRRTVHVSRSAQ